MARHAAPVGDVKADRLGFLRRKAERQQED